MQLSCNVLTKPHPHLHDPSPRSALFSTGQHTRGHIWVEVGGVCSVQGGRRCSMQSLDGVMRDAATYDVSQQPVVVRIGAWHATCSWHGERRLVVLYSGGDWRTLPPWDRALHCIPPRGCIPRRCIVGHLEEHCSGHGAWRIPKLQLMLAWYNSAMPAGGVSWTWSIAPTMPR